MLRTRCARLATGIQMAVLLAGGTAALGQSVLQESFGLAAPDLAFDVDRTRDGGQATAGRVLTGTEGPGDVYVNRFDACGDLVWSRLFGSVNQASDIGHSIRQIRDGGFVIGAETAGVSARRGIGLARLRPDGTLVWANAYPGTPFEDSPAGATVRLDADDFVVVGRIRDPEAGLRGVLHRVDSSGAPLLQRRYSPPTGAVADLSFVDVVPVPGGTAVCGWYRPAQGVMRALVARLDANGVPLWSRTYDLPEQATSADGLMLAPGALVWTGRATSAAGGVVGIVCQIDLATGAPGWTRVVSDFRPGFAAIVNNDNRSVVVAGGTLALGRGAAVEFGPAGNFIRGMQYGPPQTSTFLHGLIDFPEDTGFGLAGQTLQQPGIGGVDSLLLRTDPLLRSGCREQPFEPVTFAQVLSPERPLVVTPEPGVQEWRVFEASPDTRLSRHCVRCCRADFNGDGNLDPDDLADYIACYFAMPPCILADFNNDSNVDPDDLSDYIGAFFAGC